MRKFIRIVFLLLIVILYAPTVMAASGDAPVTVKFEPSSNSVKVGETFTVVLSQECSDGIISIDSNLEYDKSVFELTNLSFANGWSNYGAGDNITAMANEDIKSGNVFTLSFKALSSKTSRISLVGIKAYKDYDDIVNIEDKSIEISVTDEAGTPGAILTGISVTNQPSTTTYIEGTRFDQTGMEITANYNDGTSKPVTNYTYSPTEGLKVENQEITISYTENGVTQTVKQPITVRAQTNNDQNSNNNENNNNDENLGNNAQLQGITLDETNLELVLGVTKEFNLIAKANPSGASLPEIVWSSSNEKIAKLQKTNSDRSITVVPVAAGDVTITAKTADGKYSATANVKIKENGNVSGDTKNTTNTAKTTKDNTTSGTKLPKAGNMTLIVVGVVLVLIGIAIVFYKQYEKYKGI